MEPVPFNGRYCSPHTQGCPVVMRMEAGLSWLFPAHAGMTRRWCAAVRRPTEKGRRFAGRI